MPSREKGRPCEQRSRPMGNPHRRVNIGKIGKMDKKTSAKVENA
jgi:hypothetical protein